MLPREHRDTIVCLCFPYYVRFISEIEGMLEKDLSDNRSIGEAGAALIINSIVENGENNIKVLTHCNTGSLATAGYGTALGVIRALHARKQLGKFKFYFQFYLFKHSVNFKN